MKNHNASASQLSELMNTKLHTVINLSFARIAKKISKHVNKLPPIRKNGTFRWWCILADGELKGKYFIWTLKNELVEAIEELKFYFPEEIYFEEQISENIKIYNEGAVKQITINAYERNPIARNKCIEHYGFDCYICGFNFEKFYGEIGKDYIHVHHINPISEIKRNYEINPVKDLRPVCPNCHSMIHRRKDVLKIEELKSFIKGG